MEKPGDTQLLTMKNMFNQRPSWCPLVKIDYVKADFEGNEMRNCHFHFEEIDR